MADDPRRHHRRVRIILLVLGVLALLTAYVLWSYSRAALGFLVFLLGARLTLGGIL